MGVKEWEGKYKTPSNRSGARCGSCAPWSRRLHKARSAGTSSLLHCSMGHRGNWILHRYHQAYHSSCPPWRSRRHCASFRHNATGHLSGVVFLLTTNNMKLFLKGYCYRALCVCVLGGRWWPTWLHLCKWASTVWMFIGNYSPGFGIAVE